VLFALHVAAQPALWERWPLLFGFVAILSAGLWAVAAWQGPEWLHLLGAGAPVAALVAFVTSAPAGTAWPGLGAFVLLFAAIDLGAPPAAARLGRAFRAEGRLGVWAAPPLFVVLAVLAQHAAADAPWTFAAVSVLLLAGCGASAAARGCGVFQGVSAVLAAAALWPMAGTTPWADLPAARALALLLAAALAGLVSIAAPLAAERAGRPLRLPFRPAPPLEAAALLGHFLVLGLATHRAWPPETAPLLAVLAVLHLALVADALRRRSGAVAVASAALVALVVLSAANYALPALLVAVTLAAAVAAVFLVAWRTGADAVALGAAGVGAAAILAGSVARLDPGDELLVAVPLWLLALAYPLLRGARGRAERLSYAGAIAASAAFFLGARGALVALGAGPFIAVLPVAQALLLVPHLVLLVRGGGPGAAAPPRGTLALVAGAALAFVTVAIPLQLEKQWITIGWAVEGAALAWLWRRVPHRGLLAACGGLLAAVLVRLVANPEILRYHAKSATPIWNWYLYAYLVAAAAAFVAARFLSGGDDRPLRRWPRLSALAAASGTILLFALLNVEIADFFSPGPRLVFRFSAGLAQDLTYTIGWALFALGVLAAGVALGSRAARAAAIALLSATVLKAFLHDLARLDGLYRVASFVGLAASLALVAVVLQRFVLRPAPGRAPPEVP
jgi:hypothetical protein